MYFDVVRIFELIIVFLFQIVKVLYCCCRVLYLWK